ncbi:hypothetical protein [Streptomyces sp. NBC_01092]|uniref:hypothetical protein n=1 Tax=Streptomyces sp. NBC_01092 TaxID=2903748 RepID=UPI0038636D20|nr:hypothetical protein OG254_14315 [Streptomyces sp. NBC_01092]
MTLAASSFWDDWPKFVPGWLAFVATVGTWIYKAWTRRHTVALGAADDELREALEAARTRFEDIIAQGRRADWFMDEKRRETARKIRDLSERRKDEALRVELTKVADAWDETFALAPGAGGPWVRFMDQPSTPQERAESARVQAQFGKEADVARTALEHITTALTRLNELERKTLGRS